MAERKRRSDRNIISQGYAPQQQAQTQRQQQPQYQQSYQQPAQYQYQPSFQQPYQNSYRQADQRKRSTLLLIGGAIGLLYLIYIIGYMISTMNSLPSGDSMEAAAEGIGKSIAMAMITPHVIVFGIGFIFNALAWAFSKPGFALTAGILYAVSAVLMFVYALFVVPSLVLAFVGYAKLKKGCH